MNLIEQGIEDDLNQCSVTFDEEVAKRRVQIKEIELKFRDMSIHFNGCLKENKDIQQGEKCFANIEEQLILIEQEFQEGIDQLSLKDEITPTKTIVQIDEKCTEFTILGQKFEVIQVAKNFFVLCGLKMQNRFTFEVKGQGMEAFDLLSTSNKKEIQVSEFPLTMSVGPKTYKDAYESLLQTKDL